MMIPRIFWFSCVFLFFFSAQSQQFAFRELSLKKGLPQSQVRAINQDQAGFIWVGTLGGLARFDGKKFEVFTVENGLLSNRITFIDFIDDVLFVGHENGISKMIAPGLFLAVPKSGHPEAVRFSHLVRFQNRILVSSNGLGLFELEENGLKRINPDIPDPDDFEEFQRIRKMAVLGNRLYFATRGGLFYTEDLTKFDVFDETIYWSISDLAVYEDGIILTNYNESVYHFSLDDKRLPLFVNLSNKPCAKISIKPSNGKILLWLLTEENTLIKKKVALPIQEKQENHASFWLNKSSGLPQEAVSFHFVDAHGVLWIGTEGKGLFQFLGEAFAKYEMKAPVLTILKDADRQFWLGSLSGGLIPFLNQMKVDDLPKDFLGNSVWCSLKDSQGRLWFGTNTGLFVLNNGKWLAWNTENQKLLPDNKISALHEDAQGAVWVGTRRGIARVENLEFEPVEMPNIEAIQVVRAMSSLDDELIVATKTNLYRLHWSRKTLSEIKFGTASPTLSSVYVDHLGVLWIGAEEGLYFFDGNEVKLIRYTFNSAEKFVNFVTGHDDWVIVGTNNGLFEFTAFDQSLASFDLRHFDEAYGLTGTETNLNAVYVERPRGDKLWFGTSEALFSLDYNKLNPALAYYSPKIFLNDFQVNYVSVLPLNLRSEIQLKYNENRLRLSFQILDLYHSEKVHLEYRLDDQEAWTVIGTGSEIVFDQLAPGRYNLQVRALSGNGNYSDLQIMRFVILQPFYATWWFILLMLIGAGVITVFVVQYRIQQIRTQENQERLELSNRLNALEQQSLNASMNRHFIFNALNSIQYFINTQDKLSANKYLSKFAQLIRKNLDSSAAHDSRVTLAEEIQRLQLYLSLEAMRFADRFEYQFDIDSEIDLDEYKIPSMLFQPFIENAIIHGILPNEQVFGKILFSAVKEDDEIVFRIEDNGVGYSKSLREKKIKGDHFSHGTSITKSRIEVIRKISGNIISMEGPQDLMDTDGHVLGTIVTIRITV